MIEITLLGRVLVTVAGVPIAGEAAQRRRLALLALLCDAPLRPVSRDRLMLHLWPDNDTESARRLLSASLYVLRKALGAEAILAPGDQLQLNAELVRVDAVAFEQAARGDDPEAALALYGGPFLEGLSVPGSPEYDQWLEARRTELAQLHARVLERCAGERAARGDGDGAVAAWRKLAALDPYSAHITMGLMRALAATGNRAAALQAARIHAQLLDAEFGATPEAEVLALADELRRESEQGLNGLRSNGPPAPSPATADTVPAASPDSAPAAVPAESARAAEPGRTAEPAPTAPPGADAVAGAPPEQGPDGAQPDRKPAWAAHPQTRHYAAAAAVLVLVLAVAAFWPRDDAPIDTGPRIIAVVPRGGPGSDSAAAYLSNGMAEGVLYQLGRVQELRVTSAALSFLYRDSVMDPRDVAKRLGAHGIVQVTASRQGGAIRLIVELVDAEGRQEWSERYDLADGSLTSDHEYGIARDVARALRVDLGEARGHTTTPAAYDLVQRGRYQWSRRRPEALLEALDLFRQAVAADPDYPWAWVGLADTYNMLGSYDYGILRPAEAFPQARCAAQRALQLEPKLAPAHAAMGNIRFNYDWDRIGAKEDYDQAILLNPGYTSSKEWLAYLHISRGEMEQAERLLKEAAEYNASALVLTDLGHLYYYTGDIVQAGDYVRRALTVDPDFGRASVLYTLLQIQAGRAADAVALLEQMKEQSGSHDPVLAGLLGYAYARTGRTTEARREIAWLQSLPRARYVPAEYAAMIHIGLGEPDLALGYLERALESRSSSMVFLRYEPIVDPLRGLPRFQRIVDRVEAGRRGGGVGEPPCVVPRSQPGRGTTGTRS
jgi:DNA-binding SARP family transcriptional activator/TolB-like protein/Tfp pilus assembly protein PilF